MSVKMDDSFTAQHELVENLKKLKRTSKSQFNSVSEHLETSGETVNQLTDAMLDMRNEMGRLLTLMHGFATRQLEQETAASQRPSPQSVQDLPIEDSTEDAQFAPISSPAKDEIENPSQHNRLLSSSRPSREAALVPLPDSSDKQLGRLEHVEEVVWFGKHRSE